MLQRTHSLRQCNILFVMLLLFIFGLIFVEKSPGVILTLLFQPIPNILLFIFSNVGRTKSIYSFASLSFDHI